MPKFVLNDENLTNSYGFKIATKGIDLKRFKNNPIMLDQHYNSTSAVLGRWKDISADDKGLLTAEDDFDTDDEAALKVKGKVDRGFIRGASMGITFNREQMKQMPDGSYLLAKCELFEASIVAVPSNANSLRLYDCDGNLLSEEEIKVTLSALSITQKIKKETMDKLVLSATLLVALGLTNSDDLNAVALAVQKLADENATMKTELETAKASLKATLKQNAEALINRAIADGKLTADLKDHFTELAMTNFEAAEKVINSMPAKQKLGAIILNKAVDTGEIKTIDDFEKLSLAEQLAFKAEKADEYAKLFS